MLGTGAMGKVYRATDLRRGHPVALKVLHPNNAGKQQILDRFRREAAILTALEHPGIVRVYDAGKDAGGIDYIAMEVLEGPTLRQHLRARGPLPVEELVSIVVAIADALSVAHEQGVVHRDLKPDNVFVLPTGVKVVDFGLSMLDVEDRMTKTGVMLGTPRYMAPEQIRSAKDVDPRVDVYALGVIAHELLTNASPFPADDPAQLLGCVIEGRVHRLEEQRPDLPAGLGDVVRRAMARDRRDRFATIGAFAEALARAAGVPMSRARGSDEQSALPNQAHRVGEPVALPAPDKPRFTIPPEPVGTPGRLHGRHPSFWVAAVLVAVVFVAALVFGVRAC